MIVLLMAITLSLAALGCLIRLRTLGLCSDYPALTFFLIAQVVSTAASSLIGVQVDAYESVYIGLLTLELLSYALMIREVYRTIFLAYPGIAVLGRWSIYATLATIPFVALLSMLFARQLHIRLRTALPFAEVAAHCLTLGFAALVLIIVIAISRYPLQLHRNVIVNALLFSAILLGEAAGLIANQLTLRRFTPSLNLAMSINTLLWLTVWTIMLSREGQTRVLKLYRKKSPDDEARLLGQLDTLNTLLLRTRQR